MEKENSVFKNVWNSYGKNLVDLEKAFSQQVITHESFEETRLAMDCDKETVKEKVRETRLAKECDKNDYYQDNYNEYIHNKDENELCNNLYKKNSEPELSLSTILDNFKKTENPKKERQLIKERHKKFYMC
jgi:hypothetical protein